MPGNDETATIRDFRIVQDLDAELVEAMARAIVRVSAAMQPREVLQGFTIEQVADRGWTEAVPQARAALRAALRAYRERNGK